MKSFKFITASAIACCLAGTAAMALDTDVLPTENSVFKQWGNEGDWRIYIDESKGSCFAERTDAEKNVLQMGLTKSGDLGYLGVFTLGEESTNVREQRITISLDGNEYKGEAYKASNTLSKGYHGGYLLTNNPALVEDVMNKQNMAVTPNSGKPFTVSLAGTKMAIEAARKCNMEQKG